MKQNEENYRKNVGSLKEKIYERTKLYEDIQKRLNMKEVENQELKEKI